MKVFKSGSLSAGNTRESKFDARKLAKKAKEFKAQQNSEHELAEFVGDNYNDFYKVYDAFETDICFTLESEQQREQWKAGVSILEPMQESINELRQVTGSKMLKKLKHLAPKYELTTLYHEILKDIAETAEQGFTAQDIRKLEMVSNAIVKQLPEDNVLAAGLSTGETFGTNPDALKAVATDHKDYADLVNGLDVTEKTTAKETVQQDITVEQQPVGEKSEQPQKVEITQEEVIVENKVSEKQGLFSKFKSALSFVKQKVSRAFIHQAASMDDDISSADALKSSSKMDDYFENIEMPDNSIVQDVQEVDVPNVLNEKKQELPEISFKDLLNGDVKGVYVQKDMAVDEYVVAEDEYGLVASDDQTEIIVTVFDDEQKQQEGVYEVSADNVFQIADAAKKRDMLSNDPSIDDDLEAGLLAEVEKFKEEQKKDKEQQFEISL